MTSVWKNIKRNACMILILVSAVAQAQQMQPTEGTNLARGKVCTFDPKPSYPDCTEKGDRFDKISTCCCKKTLLENNKTILPLF